MRRLARLARISRSRPTTIMGTAARPINPRRRRAVEREAPTVFKDFERADGSRDSRASQFAGCGTVASESLDIRNVKSKTCAKPSKFVTRALLFAIVVIAYCSRGNWKTHMASYIPDLLDRSCSLIASYRVTRFNDFDLGISGRAP